MSLHEFLNELNEELDYFWNKFIVQPILSIIKYIMLAITVGAIKLNIYLRRKSEK